MRTTGTATTTTSYPTSTEADELEQFQDPLGQ